MTLQDFNGTTVALNGDGDQYPNEGPYNADYNSGGTGTTTIDTTDAVEGNSLLVHLTGGLLGLQFNPFNYNGTPGFPPESRGFAREYKSDPTAWEFNTYNRMSFWIKLPTNHSSYDPNGSTNIEFGTYVKQITNADDSSDETGGDHYYHTLNIPAVGAWTHVIIDMHPQHRRGDPANTDPGDMSYPTTTTYGGGDPPSTYNYFDTLTRFYVNDPYEGPTSYPADYLVDDFQVYVEPYEENDNQVRSLTGTYVRSSNRLIVTWDRMTGEDTLSHEVRYAFQNIHEIGWNAATPAPNGIVPPPDGISMHYDNTTLPLAGHSVVYIAMKPQNSNLFSQIAVRLDLP